MKVLLINKERGYGQHSLVQGFSGKSYGTSRYDGAYACQVCEVSLEQYEAAREDLRMCAHLMTRKWFPKFIVEEGDGKLPEVPAAVQDFWTGYNLAMDGKQLPIDPPQAMALGWAFPQEQEKDLSADYSKLGFLTPEANKKRIEEIEKNYPMKSVDEQRSELSAMKFFSLRKVAIDEGVTLVPKMPSANIVEAIIKARVEKANEVANRAHGQQPVTT